ncbi:endodeoxyribonuclease [Pantoea agglomerans]|uniref:RusA family crossover junction endodeoxyribonuclease n=1 Tax=Enterobacter agglomerans TaxID=549 RepID=UPI00083E65EC|nr:RusA family crossover junction endodeoxyribonuclease [Pantoea agglomerans]AOE41243.1 endodeoxyribonuclease [Pantoea agglomerans]
MNYSGKEYVLTLPFPPSLNHYWRHGRGKTYISEAGEAFRSEVIWQIMKARLNIGITARLKVDIVANMPDARRRDLDNLPKALFDALTHAGFMVDDSQIDDFRVRRGERVKGGALVVRVTELE